MSVETVKVKSGDSFAIINKSDLTAEHELFDESPKAAKKAAAEAPVKIDTDSASVGKAETDTAATTFAAGKKK